MGTPFSRNRDAAATYTLPASDRCHVQGVNKIHFPVTAVQSSSCETTSAVSYEKANAVRCDWLRLLCNEEEYHVLYFSCKAAAPSFHVRTMGRCRYRQLRV